MYDEHVRTNKANDQESQGRTDLEMNSVRRQKLVYHCENGKI